MLWPQLLHGGMQCVRVVVLKASSTARPIYQETAAARANAVVLAEESTFCIAVAEVFFDLGVGIRLHRVCAAHNMVGRKGHSRTRDCRACNACDPRSINPCV